MKTKSDYNTRCINISQMVTLHHCFAYKGKAETEVVYFKTACTPYEQDVPTFRTPFDKHCSGLWPGRVESQASYEELLSRNVFNIFIDTLTLYAKSLN